MPLPAPSKMRLTSTRNRCQGECHPPLWCPWRLLSAPFPEDPSKSCALEQGAGLPRASDQLRAAQNTTAQLGGLSSGQRRCLRPVSPAPAPAPPVEQILRRSPCSLQSAAQLCSACASPPGTHPRLTQFRWRKEEVAAGSPRLLFHSSSPARLVRGGCRGPVSLQRPHSWNERSRCAAEPWRGHQRCGSWGAQQGRCGRRSAGAGETWREDPSGSPGSLPTAVSAV